MKARRNTDSTEPARILGLNCGGPEGNKSTPSAAIRESRQNTVFGKTEVQDVPAMREVMRNCKERADKERNTTKTCVGRLCYKAL